MPRPVIAPRMPPTAVPAMAPPKKLARMPPATTGPTPGISSEMAAASTPPTMPPVTAPATAPLASLAPSASVIMPPGHRVAAAQRVADLVVGEAGLVECVDRVLGREPVVEHADDRPLAGGRIASFCVE